MRRFFFICILACGGCVVAPADEAPLPEFNPDLLSGQAIFGDVVALDEAPAYDVLGTTPEMQAFVGDIRNARLSVMRFNRLMKALHTNGFFDNRYDASVTQTAAETFETRVGNCISYTNLFVALARLAGLSVHYQLAEVAYPSWNAYTGLLVRNNHINVVVEGVRFDRNNPRGYTIDFNQVDPDYDAQLRLVSDAYAESLFYANLSVDQVLAGNDRLAFALLRRALHIAPENADLWINLGAFYSRHEAHSEAIASYEVAEALAPDEKLVLSGFERSYRALGETAIADGYAREVRRYRLRNPFYHFAISQTAFDAGDYAASLAAIQEALRLKRRDPRFHYMESLVYAALGDDQAARHSRKRAERYLSRRHAGGDDYGRVALSGSAG